MLNKYIRSTIIVIVQFFLPVVLLLLLTPQLLQLSHELHQAQNFFVSHKTGFFITHIFFYLALLWLWPLITYSYVKRSHHEMSKEQIHSALNAKWYLLAAMIIFEFLAWWR